MKETKRKIRLVPRISVFCLICLLTISGIMCIIIPNSDNNSDSVVLNMEDLGVPAVDSSNGIFNEAKIDTSRSLSSGNTRSGNDNINVSISGSFSPGYLGDQNKMFYITIMESYNGEHFTPAESDPLPLKHWGHELALWNVTIENMRFYYNNAPISPVDWDTTRKTPDDNASMGWLVNGNWDVYNNNTYSRRFRFNVSSFDTYIGLYELRLTFKYKILSNYTTATNRYNFTSIQGGQEITEVENIPFDVRSCVGTDFQTTAVNENNNVINNGRFFAGAKNQKLRINFNKVYPGASLNPLNVTLIPHPFMELFRTSGLDAMNIVSANSLIFTTSFYWRININQSISPGTYSGADESGYIYYDYIRSDNQVHVYEKNKYLLDIIIDYTPLIVPPSTNGMTGEVPPVHQILQGTSMTEVVVEFRNTGNVDLFDVTMGLDLSNSYIQAPYYYNAGSGDLKTELIISDRTIDWLPVAGHEFARFNLSLFTGLPKGVYYVPLVYTGWYYNNGTLGDPTEFVKTTETDFNIIRSTYNLPLVDTMAHIALEVLDLEPLITINPTSISTFVAGMHNQVINLRLDNYELYSFQNITISILTNSESPFEYKLLNGTSEHLLNKTFSTVLAGTAGVPYTTAFSVLASVKANANGIYSVPVEISGLDVFNEYVEFTTFFEVSIIPQLPEFIVVNSMNSEIVPGENFTLKITLKNVGASSANDLEAIFIGSSDYTNTFIPSGSGIVSVGSVASGEQITLVFNATAEENLSVINDFLVYMKFKYIDDLGNVYGFNDNNPISFFIRTSRKELPAAKDIFMVTSVSSPTLSRGKTITLAVTILNIGAFDITEANVTLVSNSNLFTVTSANDPTNPIVQIKSLAPNTMKSIEFDIKVANSVKYGEEYDLQLFIQYTDDKGYVKSYDNSDWLPVSLRIQDQKPEEKEYRVNWELILVGVIILIAAIIFIKLFGQAIKNIGVSGPITIIEKEVEEKDKKGSAEEEDEGKEDEKGEEPKSEKKGEQTKLPIQDASPATAIAPAAVPATPKTAQPVPVAPAKSAVPVSPVAPDKVETPVENKEDKKEKEEKEEVAEKDKSETDKDEKSESNKKK